MTFFEKLEQSIQKNNSLLSVGLDPDITKIPSEFLQKPDPFFAFNKMIIDQTHDLSACYKPNSAFYEAEGTNGIKQLEQTIAYIRTTYPEIPVILDAKRADIGNTSEKYAAYAFSYLQADAITVAPYMGSDSLLPFFAYQDKGIFVLVKTSNQGSADFQDIDVQGEPLFIRVAQKLREWQKTYKNIGMVVGATWPKDIEQIRAIVPDTVFLIPGIGAQGGDLKETLTAGLDQKKSGLLIHAGRSILYAANVRSEATKLRNQINQYR